MGLIQTIWESVVTYFRGIDPGLARAIILGLSRQGLTYIAGILSTYGLMAGNRVAFLIGAAPLVASIIYDVYDKYIVKAKITNAGIVGQAETGGVKNKDVAVAALKDTTTS